jgi:hypothetical protein
MGWHTTSLAFQTDWSVLSIGPQASVMIVSTDFQGSALADGQRYRTILQALLTKSEFL